MIPSAVFVAAVWLQNKFPLSSKFSRIPGSMPKTYTHVLSTWGKYGRVPHEKFWGVMRKHGVDGCLLTELNHNHSALVLDSDNGVCCHHRWWQHTPLSESNTNDMQHIVDIVFISTNTSETVKNLHHYNLHSYKITQDMRKTTSDVKRLSPISTTSTICLRQHAQ